MDDLHSETVADAPLAGSGAATPVRPAHLAGAGPGAAAVAAVPGPRRRRWLLPLLLVPVVLLVALVVAWAVDSSSGEVARNVELAGVPIGGLSEGELTGRVGEVAADFAAMPVELRGGDRTYTTTASELGLTVDEDATAAAALDVGTSTFPLARPFVWARSLVATRDAPVQLQVGDELVASTLLALQGEDRTPPTEPSVEVVDGTLQVVPGVAGRGVDPDTLAQDLPGAALAAIEAGEDHIALDVEVGPLAPLASDDAARAAVAEAESLVGEPLEVVASGTPRTIEPDGLRPWVRLASTPQGAVGIRLDEAAVASTLRRAFADVEGHPTDAGFTLEGGRPVILRDRPGRVCCADGAATTILESLQGGTRTVQLALVEGPASFTAADAAEWGIEQPVGGNHAWRSGAPTTAGPGFTTYHDAGGARVSNIHRMADLVRGAVIPPGGRFSINDHVGERTAEKGFVGAGAIRNGLHVTEIGGGVSQFATTLFNAAYFAGLPIDTYQAHSEYFDRYPRGREATMGFPAPDLAFTNNTPYGIMIWTSYTDSSLTVTLYSTPYARGEQTAISEGRSGSCAVVTTTRTVTYPDGRTEEDRFRATYRPGEGLGC
jgi:vancomycin resistance protein YoaR